ncbi:MAG: hypothetical protein A2Z18_10740 [Armatimonadetes bacterium RBG_16_58_9]|nr:MAG: hypothetical protein A2Z18_10740 [Armatimonadetes bacterium RBG_16_58_9]
MQPSNKCPISIAGRAETARWMVVIGANTGGPQALAELLPQFPADFPGAILVMQQMRHGFTRVLAEQLSHACKMPVHEPVDGEIVHSSRILMAPSRSSVTFADAGSQSMSGCEIHIDDLGNDPAGAATRIDAAMMSAAQSFGGSAIGVLLTGRGEDGCEGLRSISNAGGITIAQDAASSVVYDMPSRAIDAGVVGEVLPLCYITDRIVRVVTEVVDANAA